MGTYSDLLFGPSADAPALEQVQSPIERPAPIRRPGEVVQQRRPAPRPVQATPSAAPMPAPTQPQSRIPQWDGQTPQDFFLEPGAVEKLSPGDMDAYVKQRNDFFDYRQGTGRFAPQEATPQPQQTSPQAAPPAAPTQAAPQAPPRRNYSEDMLGTDPSAAAPVAPKAAAIADPRAEPDAPTWLGRRWQDVAGKQDPRFKDLPTISEALKTEGNMTAGTAGKEMWGWLTGANDQEQARVFKGILGNRFVKTEQDANGYPVVVYKGQDGQEQRAYVNKPGLDAQDVLRDVVGIAPNIGAGRLVSGAMKGAALVPRIVGQAMGQGAASVTQDVAGLGTGTRSETTPADVAHKGMISAAGGAGGEIVGAAGSALWRKFVTEPRYFNQSTGQLTQEGISAVEAAGLDPKTFVGQTGKQFAREMARTADPVAATSQIAANEFKIPRTVGELTKDQGQLLREQQITAGNYGERGATAMKSFRERQSGAIKDAVTGMADEMAPARAGQSLGKADLGANIRANTQGAYETAKGFEDKAWKAVPEMRATEEALAHLDVSIPKGLQQRGIDFIDSELTPAAAKMSKMLEDFQAGGTPQSASKYVKSDLPGKVDLMRRQLLKAYGTAENDTDKRAAKALYDSYNDWIGEVAPKIADPFAATQLVTARALSRQIHEHFDGEATSAGANVLKNVLKKADSAEGVIDALFSGQTKSSIKSGSIDAIGRLKEAYTKYLEPEAAKAATDDLKLAYFRRATMKNGELMEPKALSSSLKNMVASQRSVLTALGISPQEMGRIGRLANLLEDVARKNPNTSWSGVTMSQFLKDVGGALFSMIGGNSILAKVAAGPVLKPFQEQYGRALAGQVTRGGQGAIVPALSPPPIAGAAGGMFGSDSKAR